MSSQTYTVTDPKEYKPQYFVRMLGKLYNELVLRNVFSISTSISTTSVEGEFQIVLDNRYPPEEFWSLYHLITPMDYIEIFMRRDAAVPIPEDIKIKDDTTGKLLSELYNFGYIGPSTEAGIDGVFYPASPVVISPQTGEPSPFIIQETQGITVVLANGGFPAAIASSRAASDPNISLFSAISRPLNALEKANTPDFVFCGLVDSVHTNFSMGPNGDPQAFIVITGKSFGKLLTKHSIYLNGMINNPLIAQPFNLQVMNKTPPQAVISAIDTFLMSGTALAPLNLLIQKNEKVSNVPTLLSNNPTPLEEVASNTIASQLEPLDYTVSTIKLTQGITRTFAVFRRKFIKTFLYTKGNLLDPSGFPITSIDSSVVWYQDDPLPPWAPGAPETSGGPVFSPFISQLDASRHDIYGQPSGRLSENITAGNDSIKAFAQAQDGPLINLISQIANNFVNELWVDEAGRLVLRTINDAWFFPIYQLKNSTIEPTAAAILNAPVTTSNAQEKNNISNLIENIDFNSDGTPKLLVSSENTGLTSEQLKIVKANTNIIDGKDIISWNFQKSDENLKTLIIVQNIFGYLGITSSINFGGIAPLTAGSLTGTLSVYIAEAIKNAVGTSNTVLLPNSLDTFYADLNSKILTAVNDYVIANADNPLNNTASLQNQIITIFNSTLNQYLTTIQLLPGEPAPALSQSQILTQTVNQAVTSALSNTNMKLFLSPFNFLTYKLNNAFQIIDFWQDFLVRIDTVNNIFNSDPVASFRYAFFYFLQKAQFFANGTLVVKGDPKYKAGQRIYVRSLNADFYVTGVRHDFRWGTAPYTTTLTVSRGIFFGTLAPFNVGDITDSMTSVLQTLAQTNLTYRQLLTQ